MIRLPQLAYRWPLLGAAVLLGLPAHAAAPSFELAVDRGPDAGDCPDEAALRRLVDAQADAAGGRDDVEALRFRVEFVRDARYFAVVQVQGRTFGQRVLRDSSERCSDLAEAVATSIALILEQEPETRPAPQPEPAAAPAPTASEAPPPVATPAQSRPPKNYGPPPRATALEGSVALGPALGWEVVPDAGPGAFGQIGYWAHDLVRVGLGVLWLPAKSLDFAGGEFSTSAVALVPAACSDLTDSPIRWLGCVETPLTISTAEGQGFRKNFSATSTLWMLGGALEVGIPLGPSLGWTVRASVWCRLQGQDIEIEGSGNAHTFSPIAAMGTTMLSMEL